MITNLALEELAVKRKKVTIIPRYFFINKNYTFLILCREWFANLQVGNIEDMDNNMYSSMKHSLS